MWLARLGVYALIAASLLVAFLLDVYPVALEYRFLRPQFVLLVLIYWVLVFPQTTRFSLILLLGLIHDTAVGVPLGQSALVFLLVAFLCLRMHHRLRHFSRWQEVLVVMALVAVAQLVGYWVQSLAGRPFDGWQFMLAALASACVWPLLALILDALRRRYRIARQV